MQVVAKGGDNFLSLATFSSKVHWAREIPMGV